MRSLTPNLCQLVKLLDQDASIQSCSKLYTTFKVNIQEFKVCKPNKAKGRQQRFTSATPTKYHISMPNSHQPNLLSLLGRARFPHSTKNILDSFEFCVFVIVFSQFMLGLCFPVRRNRQELILFMFLSQNRLPNCDFIFTFRIMLSEM